jgi:PKD repeat protein
MAVGSTTVTLNGSSSLACGTPITNYVWDFGDGTSGEGLIASHVYGVGEFYPRLTVTDATGNVSSSNAQSYKITVKESNTAPVATDLTLNVAHQYSYSLDLTNQVSDPDGDWVSVLPSSATPNTVQVLRRSEKLLEVSNVPWTASSVEVIYQVSDQFGGTTLGKVVLNISNQPPTAADGAYTVPEDSALHINPWSLASDPEKAPLTFSFTQPSHGQIIVGAGQSYTYQPAANYNGEDSVTYTVSDGRDTATGTIRFTITPVNDLPTVTIPTLTTDEDTTVTFNPLAGSNDVEGDPVTLKYLIGSPNGTSWQNADGSITFRPSGNYNGTTTLRYYITDGIALREVVATIVVAPVNDVPYVSVPLLVSTNEDTAVTFDPLANVSDADGDSLTVSDVTVSGGGGIAQNTDGTITFTPLTNFAGTATISYVISDGTTSVQRSVTVTVTPVNDAPVITALVATNAAKSGKSYVLTATTSDADNDSLVYTWDFGDGTTATTSDGNVRHNYNRKGTFTVTLTVKDPTGATATRSVTINL